MALKSSTKKIGRVSYPRCQGVKRELCESVDDVQLSREQLKQIFDFFNVMSRVGPLANRGFKAIATGNDKVLEEVLSELDSLKKRG